MHGACGHLVSSYIHVICIEKLTHLTGKMVSDKNLYIGWDKASDIIQL